MLGNTTVNVNVVKEVAMQARRRNSMQWLVYT